jgi:hypothetical protein
VDIVQQQLSIISEKIDGLYQQQEILSAQVSELLSSKSLQSQAGLKNGNGSGSRQVLDSHPTVHRDILVDQDPVLVQDHGNSKPMSQELQMQRLMAQLTAAYNRIAALEEQLIAQRIH